MHFPKKLSLSETLLKAFYRQGKNKSVSYFGKHLVRYFLRSDYFIQRGALNGQLLLDVDLLELLLNLAS